MRFSWYSAYNLNLYHPQVCMHSPNPTPNAQRRPFPLHDPLYFPITFPSPQTKWSGRRKFATPSLTTYSCPQFAHTSFPALICVSISRTCKSLSSCSSVARSSGAGAVGGSAGSPSWDVLVSCPSYQKQRSTRVRRLLMKKDGETNFSRNSRQRIPIQARQQVSQQLRVRRQVLGDELGVLGV